MDQDKNKTKVRCWCLTPVILATQEAEIRRIVVRSQAGKIVPSISFEHRYMNTV
jgi:hypothetical protein